jgi:hypothetical protein
MAIVVDRSVWISKFCALRGRDGCAASPEDLDTFLREILTYFTDVTTMRGKAKEKI